MRDEAAGSWGSPPERLVLSDQEVHVWRARLDLDARSLHPLGATLSPDEWARAERYRFPKDRDSFIAARGILRAILGRYLAVAPQELRFSYSSHGKPSLCGGCSRVGQGLRFNLSHSHHRVLYAVTRGREVGIDIEYLRPELAEESIAERFFSPRESTTLRSLPAALRQEAFFNCWTRKEAYIKARGEGLTVRLDQFEVSLAPGEAAALLNDAGDPLEARRWSLRELAPGTGYAAALAVEGHDWRLQCWEWDEPL